MKKIFNDILIGDILVLIEKAKEEQRIITLHPNGFLQLPLSDSNKRLSKFQLHIWHPSIPRLGAECFSIHDHAFDIASYLISGQLLDTQYQVNEEQLGDFTLFQADGFGQMVWADSRISCHISKEKWFYTGQEYSIPKGVFHSSSGHIGLTATIIKKSHIDVHYLPRLVVPMTYAQESITVPREISQEKSWELVNLVIPFLKNP